MVGETVTFGISNCNNISNANIEILKDFLNIKYAANGTGKSTIAKAILKASKEEDLNELQSYGTEEKPALTSDSPIGNVFVFDEDFVNDVVFRKNEVIENSFEVFIKSQKYDEKLEALNTRLRDFRIDIRKDEEIVKMRGIFSEVASKIKFNSDGEIRSNPFIKSLISEEHIFNISDNLAIFRPFFESDYNIEWIDWKNKGYNFDDMDKCPFCTDQLKEDYNIEKSTFKKSYTKSNAKNMKDMLSFFESLEKYISDDKYELLNECIKSSSDKGLILGTLKKFVTELTYIEEKISELVNFDSYRIKSDEISLLDQKIKNFKLSISFLDVFDNTEMRRIINRINENIDSILSDVTVLKTEVGLLKGLIQASAKKSRIDINRFLESAGINYEIIIDVVAENDSKTILKYKDVQENTYEVDDIKKHLSWGEKNAFALVLFMHYATSANADLIILDDPISSFDSDKKYAIINRLFKNNQNDRTFYNRTVLMLTHDLEPVIDFVVNNKPTGGFVSAAYLANRNGTISETKIGDNDIQSHIKLLANIIKDEQLKVIHRLIAMRKLIEHTGQTDEEGFAYKIISSLIHGKKIPDKIVNNEHLPMVTAEIDLGTSHIKDSIPEFSYGQILNDDLASESLLEAYNDETCNYLKLQIFRVYLEIDNKRATMEDDILLKYIDETYHIENDYLYNLDYRKYDVVPDFIIKKCDGYIKNQSTI